MGRLLFLKLHILIIVILLLLNVTILSATGFSPEKAGFSVKFKDEISPYRIIGVFVLPEEKLTFEVLDLTKHNQYILQASAGKVNKIKTNKWQWQAPKEKGLHHVKIIRSQVEHPSKDSFRADAIGELSPIADCENLVDSITLNIFVMVPYNQLKGEYLNGYCIGKYPAIPLRRLPIYEPPKGFIEVTKENKETKLSPHFRLKQFLCKQEGDYPRYVALRERLLLKLELVLEKVNEKGHYCETFHVMSGYRTPYYNKAIGNVKYSRHIYGGAADIFIDENPKDWMMDDLNSDNHIDYRDAAILYDIIDQMYGKPWYKLFVGGLGRYKKTNSHGPFVHVDVRGYHARWGD